MFLIDSSGSIGAEPFDKAREFLVTVLGGLNIGPNDTRVGIIEFASDASSHLLVYFANLSPREACPRGKTAVDTVGIQIH